MHCTDGIVILWIIDTPLALLINFKLFQAWYSRYLRAKNAVNPQPSIIQNWYIWVVISFKKQCCCLCIVDFAVIYIQCGNKVVRQTTWRTNVVVCLLKLRSFFRGLFVHYHVIHETVAQNNEASDRQLPKEQRVNVCSVCNNHLGNVFESSNRCAIVFVISKI